MDSIMASQKIMPSHYGSNISVIIALFFEHMVVIYHIPGGGGAGLYEE